MEDKEGRKDGWKEGRKDVSTDIDYQYQSLIGASSPVQVENFLSNSGAGGRHHRLHQTWTQDQFRTIQFNKLY